MNQNSLSSQIAEVVLMETSRSQEWIGILMITTEKQFPQDPTHDFQATEEAEEEPVILDPNIDLDIDH